METSSRLAVKQQESVLEADEQLGQFAVAEIGIRSQCRDYLTSKIAFKSQDTILRQSYSVAYRQTVVSHTRQTSDKDYLTSK